MDKSPGPTSFRLVQQVRRALGVKKVGHAGTLDPFASGLLIICVGRPATKIISRFMDGEKEYEARLRLGIETETQDPEGEVTRQRPVGAMSLERIDQVLAGYVGDILQTPPHFSALKHKGKPLYYYARKGVKIEKEPRKVFIREITVLGSSVDTLDIRVVCSRGTYIRTLAADIGNDLGCGAHLTALRRLRSGSFRVSEALDGQVLDNQDLAPRVLLENMLSVDEALQRLARETERI